MTTQQGMFPSLAAACLSKTPLQPGDTLAGQLEQGGYLVSVSVPDVGASDQSVQVTVTFGTATITPTDTVLTGTGQFNIAQGVAQSSTGIGQMVYFKNTGSVSIQNVSVALVTQNFGQSAQPGA